MKLIADLLLDDGREKYVEKHLIVMPDQMDLKEIKKEDFEKEIAKSFNLQSCTLLSLVENDSK